MTQRDSDRRQLAGRFDLLRELGSGSSGTVHEARLREPYRGQPKGAEVAVKFLRQDLATDEKAHERMLAEGELGMKVRHPNVAAIFGVESIELLGLRATYLVMEMVHGTTLRALLQQSGPPVEDLTRRIGADAAAGLHALHKRGVVHRDVKPENLILTPQGQLKVVDLGLARPFGARGYGSSSSGGVAGSVSYPSPEVLRLEPATPRSDLYSLGILLFEVATGRHPFAECTTADDMIDAHLHRQPPRPSHLRPRMSSLLEQLLQELLAKDPEIRPRNAAEVTKILLEGERSTWWRHHESSAPALASGRRLRQMRRPAETPFCGRERELVLLGRALDRARDGNGRAFCIAGPEGIGRHRLLDEAMALWLEHSDDLLYLGGEADPGLGHGEPFASTLLDYLLRGDGADSPNAIARAAHRARDEFDLDEAAAQALAAVAAGHSQEPPEVRADRLASALLLLPRKGRTLVLRVGRADRLDTSGTMVLNRLLHEVRNRHLLLLLTSGPDALQTAAAERLELGGLTADAFLAFGRALFAAGEADEAFLTGAHASLSGSPGNLLESLEYLVHQGQLHGRPGGYQGLAADAEPRPAPPHVARFQARVAGLPELQRHVLETAAVLGDSCPLRDLTALSGANEMLALETLSLFRGRILRAQGGVVAFRHHDFRLALLRQVPTARRVELHQAAARILRDRGAPPLEIGMHLSQAEDHLGCIDPLLTALGELVQAGSRRTSLRVSNRLRLHFAQLPADPAIEPKRLRFQLLWAAARYAAGQGDRAEEQFRAANLLARQLGDREALAEALSGLAQVADDRGQLFAAVDLLERAHRELGDLVSENAHRIAAKAHGRHGRILFYLGQSEAALQHLGLAIARLPQKDQDLWCHLQIDLARTEALRQHFPTALKTLHKVERARSARHLPRVRMRLHLYRGQLLSLLGDEGAREDLVAAIADAERLGVPAYAARARIFLAERALRRGRVAEATQELVLARQAADTIDPMGAALAAIYLHELGERDSSLGPQTEQIGSPSLRAAWLLAEAKVRQVAGDAAGADQLLLEAERLGRESDLPLTTQVRAHKSLGRQAAALKLIRDIAARIAERSVRKRFLAEWERMEWE